MKARRCAWCKRVIRTNLYPMGDGKTFYHKGCWGRMIIWLSALFCEASVGGES